MSYKDSDKIEKQRYREKALYLVDIDNMLKISRYNILERTLTWKENKWG